MNSGFLTAHRIGGGRIRYRPEPLGEGTMKVVYPAADGQSVIAFYKDATAETDPARLSRLEAVLGRFNPTLDAPTGTFWQQLYCWPTDIVTRPSLGIVTPKFPDHYYFAAGPLAGQEKQGTWFVRPRLRGLLPTSERGPWTNYLRVAIQLARAVRRLHQAGLSHADLSPRNALIDPTTGRACLIDLDALVVPGLYQPEVAGTPGYLAPEVLTTLHLPVHDAGRFHPSTATDRHALAVLIYEYLLFRHPLRGPKVNSVDSAEEDQFLSLGPKALYIEHPTDTSNRPPDLGVPAAALGPAIADLFERAFVAGLHAPDDRPAAIEWERALVRAWDRLVPCANDGCDHGAFVLIDPARPTCPFCGAAARPTPYLALSSTGPSGRQRDEGLIVLAHRRAIAAWHATSGTFPAETADRRPVAHAVSLDGWTLVNDRLPDLAILKGDGPGRTCPPGSAITLTPGLRIRLDAGSAGRSAEVGFLGG